MLFRKREIFYPYSYKTTWNPITVKKIVVTSIDVLTDWSFERGGDFGYPFKPWTHGPSIAFIFSQYLFLPTITYPSTLSRRTSSHPLFDFYYFALLIVRSLDAQGWKMRGLGRWSADYVEDLRVDQPMLFIYLTALDIQRLISQQRTASLQLAQNAPSSSDPFSIL